ncbi:FMN-binding protein [Petroclostridium sp. X23]|uniref:FMN-binding protein n=1 Tax=Petroclostridium sp. X23 TaxID=3045146 RepID=UPI0024AE0205|nr:FMN-binding protein [Petroclostridium sp. X23]WHH61548.1 FMN-binding protein [Petroclostridium sp. X23]
MKRTVLLLLVLLINVFWTACASQEVYYKAGSYEGSGNGHHGPIKVVVTTDEHNVTEIKITEEYEMPELSSIVYDKIPKRVIKTNSADVDVVAGATYTSEGLIEAIGDALEKAYVNKKE